MNIHWIDWVLDRLTNPSGRYRDGTRLRTYKELKARDRYPQKHEHRFEWCEADWGVYAWICECGEVDGFE